MCRYRSRKNEKKQEEGRDPTSDGEHAAGSAIEKPRPGSSYDPAVREDVHHRACKLTLREVCQQEFDRFQERFKSTKAKDYPLSVLLSFWAGEGRALYLNMARVARVLLSVPASAAVLERDFSTAGRLITGSRSRLAGEYVEMTLFLNGNKEYIPVEVPSLSESQMKEAVPRRLTNPRAEVAALSTGVEDVVPVVVFDANINDEYAAEATSV